MNADPIAERLRGMAPLEIPAEYRAGVAMWLDILAGHAATFGEGTLPETVEPAPVFRA